MYSWKSIWYELEFFHVFATYTCVFFLIFVTPRCFKICIGTTSFPCRITCSNLIRSGISYCNASNNFKQIPSPAVFCVQLTQSYRGRPHIPWCSQRKHCPIKGWFNCFLCHWESLVLIEKAVNTNFYSNSGWVWIWNKSLLTDATRQGSMWAAEHFKSYLLYNSLIFKGKKLPRTSLN